MENNKTAVQWLQDKLFELEIKIDASIAEETFFLFAQAKQMEKDKIREAYYRGVKDEMQNVGKDFEDFYNETYNKKDHA